MVIVVIIAHTKCKLYTLEWLKMVKFTSVNFIFTFTLVITILNYRIYIHIHVCE